MSEEELSEEELNSLLSDLEARSEEGGGAEPGADSTDGEDIEAFLKSVEEEQGGEPDEVAVAERAESAGPDLSELENADELPAKSEGSKPAPQKEEADGDEESTSEAEPAEKPETQKKGADAGGSDVWPVVWLVAKWTGYSLPVLALWWVFGAFLGQWISAGWLIFVVATAFVVGVPKLLFDFSGQKGKFRWWIAGASVVLTTALIAPMPSIAGKVLTNYGHWPATTVADAAGWDDSALVDANAAAGEWLGRTLFPALPAAETKLDLGDRSAPSDPAPTPE